MRRNWRRRKDRATQTRRVIMQTRPFDILITYFGGDWRNCALAKVCACSDSSSRCRLIQPPAVCRCAPLELQFRSLSLSAPQTGNPSRSKRLLVRQSVLPTGGGINLVAAAAASSSRLGPFGGSPLIISAAAAAAPRRLFIQVGRVESSLSALVSRRRNWLDCLSRTRAGRISAPEDSLLQLR